MVHPDLLSAYSIGIAKAPVWDIFGFKIQAIGYQGTVLPVLAVAFILATIEKKLHKVTPTWLDNLTTPLITIMVTSFLTFICVGPVLREAGNLLADGITWVYNTLGFVGGGLFGLAYAPICLTGMHHCFIAIETQLIAAKATTGGSFIFTTASMNNVAQGAVRSRSLSNLLEAWTGIPEVLLLLMPVPKLLLLHNMHYLRLNR